jgi:nucleotide-binding universal stress UspA family protein
MSTQFATTPQSYSEPNPHPRLDLSGRPVLLASDGSLESAAAARVAFALAERHHADIHVVRVMDSRPAPIPPPLDLAIAIADASIGDGVHTEQMEQVRADIAAAAGATVSWPVHIILGSPAHAIVQEARRLRTALVIVGLRRHGRLERAMQDETSLEVMRNAMCPVLGVAIHATGLPMKVLAAMDFSLASLSAARAARAVMADDGTIVLAYTPPVSFDLPDDGEAVIHRLGLSAAFAQCRAELGADGVRTDEVVLHRELSTPVASALLEYADSARCDLISAGSARRGRIDRWMLGSVSTDLVRDGRHSVLVVPPRPAKADTTPDD